MTVAAGFIPAFSWGDAGSRRFYTCGKLAWQMQKSIRERRHRLPRDCYKGLIRVTFTFCIENRAPIFKNAKVVAAALECLQQAQRKHMVKNWAYVFMPDHLHCILEGESEQSDLWQAAVDFKHSSGFWFYQQKLGARWQKDFYDHIHRKDEELTKHIYYILDNPVRQGIVQDWKEYPYLGSLDYKLEEIL